MGERKLYSTERLQELRVRLAGVRELVGEHPLCIYATGSYGRLEAWRSSDIDLFLIHDSDLDDSGAEIPVPTLTLIPLFARLIEITEDLNFPPFSGDGKYLTVGSVAKMESVLGSPQDDSINAFTSRMLLLLESQPLYDENLYDQLLERIIGFYYRDFQDHPDDFVPSFLINDILRFWRTLTLNYEHDRLKLKGLIGDDLEHGKAKSALKNYKLKFSRLATCYSMIASLVAEKAPVTSSRVLELCRTVPMDRFRDLGDRFEQATEVVGQLQSKYETFLGQVQRDESDLLATFSRKDFRREALSDADEFGGLIYQLLESVAQPGRLRYLVV